MALLPPKRDDAHKQALLKDLDYFIDPSHPLSKELAGSPGLEVFVLGLQDVLKPGFLDRAHSVGWRFLAGSVMGGPAVSAITTRSGDGHALTSFSAAHEIAGILQALHEVETLTHVL